MSMNTVPERLAALREAMKANGVDVYLIPVGDPHASEYMPDHYTALTYLPAPTPLLLAFPLKVAV